MSFNNLTIKEIKNLIQDIEINQELINKLENDPRKGVKKIALSFKKKLRSKQDMIKKWQKMNSKIIRLTNKGYDLIAGIDEAGRGPLFGPVVAAAVILAPQKKIIGLDDSKKLTAEKREDLYQKINEFSLDIGLGIVDNNAIDKFNIQQATFMAMKKAVENLDLSPDYILVDGNQKIPELSIIQEAVINGDQRINAIAAASIIAKVTRDNIIDRYHHEFPQYDLINNKGYGTEKHIKALKQYGATPLHRLSFKIVNNYKSGNNFGDNYE